MQVTAANVYVVPVGNRTGVILELETDAGITGIGEAGVAYGMGTEAGAEMVLKMVKAGVLGQDPGPVERICSDIYDRGFWTKNAGAVSGGGLAAINVALWDIKGKTLGVPVHSLFGGPYRDRIGVYGNGWWMGCDSAEDFAAAAKRAVASGIGGLKLYPLGLLDPVTIIRHPSRRRLAPEHLDLAVARVAAIREAVGPAIGIYLDFGSGLHADQMKGLLRRLEPLGVGFIEEPVDPSMPEAAARLGTSIPIAAGERAFQRYGFQRMLNAGGYDILQPSVCNTGGLSEALRIAALGEIHNCAVAPHNYGSPLATVIAAQLAASIPNFQLLEIFPDFRDEPGYRQIIDAPLEDQIGADSTVPVPQGPGLGVSLVREVVAPFLWKRIEA